MSVAPAASHTRVPAGKPIIATARSPAAASRATPRRERTPARRQPKVISIVPLRRARGRGSLRFRRDLHRQHGDALFRRRRLLRRHLPPPFEQLVGVHIMPPRHDRNRRARLQRLGHDLTLQRLGPLPTLGPAATFA